MAMELQKRIKTARITEDNIEIEGGNYYRNEVEIGRTVIGIVFFRISTASDDGHRNGQCHFYECGSPRYSTSIIYGVRNMGDNDSKIQVTIDYVYIDD